MLYYQGIHSDAWLQAVGDLRSALVKEACVTTEILSAHLQNNFVLVAESILPAVFRQVTAL
jgi:hypothetical protein